MSMQPHFQMLARYNQWMNDKIYEAASHLPAEALKRDRGAFFGSILGTLNHLVVADIIWLKRFASHPACAQLLKAVASEPHPESLDQLLHNDLQELSAKRIALDALISNFVEALSEADLDFVLRYHNTRGVAANRRFSSLMLHFFNHQTHHRGQVSTLLNQAGVDIGVTDLLAMIPDETAA